MVYKEIQLEKLFQELKDPSIKPSLPGFTTTKTIKEQKLINEIRSLNGVGKAFDDFKNFEDRGKYFNYQLRKFNFKSQGNQYLVAMVLDLICKRLSIKGIFAEFSHHQKRW